LSELSSGSIANRVPSIRFLTGDWSGNRFYRLAAGLRMELARILSERFARFNDLSTALACR